MQGDVFHSEPGQFPSVEIVADGSGNVPERGDAVELVDESDQAGTPQAQLTSGADGVGAIVSYVKDYDETTSYASGDVVGQAAITGNNAGIEWKDTSESLAVDDKVVTTADGEVAAYDSAGGDTPDLIYGRVWSAASTEVSNAGKVAIMRD